MVAEHTPEDQELIQKTAEDLRPPTYEELMDKWVVEFLQGKFSSVRPPKRRISKGVE